MSRLAGRLAPGLARLAWPGTHRLAPGIARLLRQGPRVAASQIRPCATQPVRRETLFFDPSVQELLLRLQGRDHAKVFRTRKLGVEPDRPVYQFMTTEELEEAREEVEGKMDRKLVMPPVMDERSATSQLLETDPLLQGHDTYNYVFTDITFGVANRERLIVVREPAGGLRTATWEEQDRVNLTYYPEGERRHYDPPMFEPKNLEEILGPEKYEYVMDRTCLQYEPDHPTHIRTAGLVHSHVSAGGHFDCLLGTRHYGPMVFQLCWARQQDALLVHLVTKDRMDRAADVVAVYLKLHPDCPLAATPGLASLPADQLLRTFCQIESLKPGKISMAVSHLAEQRAERDRLLSSHGASA